MDAILVPIDFSETSKNAAIYALQLAEQLGVNRLVLYHSYEIPVSVDPLVPGIQMLDMDSLKESSENSLKIFKMDLLAFADDTSIETFNEYGALTQGLDEVCEKVNAGMVVMGITGGGGALEEALIGSNAITVANHTKLPVIIVPAKARFTPIDNVMLTTDFDKTDETIPVDLLISVLNETKAKLYVFNIEKEEDVANFQLDGIGKNYALHSYIAEFEPEYHFSTNTNYPETVNDFALEYRIDLIITIPKKHGFFGSLFAHSHTKELAFHSHVPVMVVHE